MSNPKVPTMGITIQNDSGMVIPPRSIVVCTSVEIVSSGVDDDGQYQESIAVHHITQYAGQAGNIFVTGAVSIDPSSSGSGSSISGRTLATAYYDQFIYVAVDPSLTDPNVGEVWGPVSGKWTLGLNGWGFLSQGYAANSETPKMSMFYRGIQGPQFAKLVTNCASGDYSAPAATTVDIWVIDMTSMASAKPLIRSTNPSLQAQPAVSYFTLNSTATAGTKCMVQPSANGWQLIDLRWC